MSANHVPQGLHLVTARDEFARSFSDLTPHPSTSRITTSAEDALICKKIARIQNGGPIRYMDMFAGCGGISLGFLTAGFTPVASVENDLWAARSHGANFGIRSAGGDRLAHHVPRDAVTETAETVFTSL